MISNITLNLIPHMEITGILKQTPTFKKKKKKISLHFAPRFTLTIFNLQKLLYQMSCQAVIGVR